MGWSGDGIAPGTGRRYPAGMAEVVNLNRARKAREREAAASKAVANRAAHGRTKAERARDAAAEAKRDAMLDGALLKQQRPEDAG